MKYFGESLKFIQELSVQAFKILYMLRNTRESADFLL